MIEAAHPSIFFMLLAHMRRVRRHSIAQPAITAARLARRVPLHQAQVLSPSVSLGSGFRSRLRRLLNSSRVGAYRLYRLIQGEPGLRGEPAASGAEKHFA